MANKYLLTYTRFKNCPCQGINTDPSFTRFFSFETITELKEFLQESINEQCPLYCFKVFNGGLEYHCTFGYTIENHKIKTIKFRFENKDYEVRYIAGQYCLVV